MISFKTIVKKINASKMIQPCKAFTLAEVLITLGIIGVVAAITLPVLLDKIQDMQFRQAAKEAFSKASQAVSQMRMENGGTLDSYFISDFAFKTKFMKYFNVLEDCGESDCVPYSASSTIYHSLSGNNASLWCLDEGQFTTADGFFYGFQIATSGKYAVITVDVNGYAKGPNIFGKDTFFFQTMNNTLYPMGALNTNFSIPTYCSKSTSDSLQGTSCMYYVMQDVYY